MYKYNQFLLLLYHLKSHLERVKIDLQLSIPLGHSRSFEINLEIGLFFNTSSELTIQKFC